MRILHTMLRVGDLQRSIDFYTKLLGMKLLRQVENTEYKYTLAYLCLLYTSPSPRDQRGSRMPSSA